ncbi:hypothetical protein BH23GEM5_BH23GEM5_06700 [soil metagenome]
MVVVFWLAIVATLLIRPPVVFAQIGAVPSPAAADSAPPALPSPLEVTTRYRTLADSALLAEREIARLADVEALAADLKFARQRQSELRQLLRNLVQTEYIHPERITRVRNQALLDDQRLEQMRERASTRLEELGRLRSEWMERRNFWTSWQDALRTDPQYALVAPEFRQATQRIDAVLQQIARVAPDVLRLQREIQGLRTQTQEIGETVAEIRAGRREAVLRRDQPWLFGSVFQAQLRDRALREWDPVPTMQAGFRRAFFRENAARIIFHALFALVLALIARYFRRRTGREALWSGVLLHPWAIGIFASTALMAQRYALTPPLWDVAMWSLLAGSGALLATRVIGPRPLRVMVYFFAAVYPLFLLAEASRLPVPLFRLGLAGASVIGLGTFALLAVRSGRRPHTQARVRWGLGVGATIWAVLLGAETFGFYGLARWILHATVASALIVFTVSFLVVVARGAIRTMLRMEAKGRLRFLRNVGVPLAERLVVLFQAILIIWAALAVLDVWELIGSPLESWNAVKDMGVTLVGINITVGRVVIAWVVVYLAMLGSWITRTFIRSEVSPRWDLDRGVGESISTLLHYLLLTLGVLFALGALGVELQNFAIIAGALGVGIGFGLQNVVNNFVSGLILLFERPVRVGDIVVVGGEWGTIKKIGLRSTIVVTFDQSEMIVPNGDLVSEKVTNWTLSNPITRVVLPVGVAYGSDVQRVLQILREAAVAHPGVLAEPAPQALFVAFGDSALDFELRVWVKELLLRPQVKSTILAEVDHRFRAAGIEIPFPQRDLHLRSVDSGVVEALLRGRPARGDGESPPPL